jgi:multiple sugar transport system permease protein
MRAVRRTALYTTLTLFAVVFIFPFLLSLATSFKSRPEVSTNPVLPWPLSPTGRAWSDVILHSDFPLWTFNSVLVTVAATLGRVFLDSLAGYALARLRWPGRTVVFAGVLAVLAVPPIVLTVPRFLVLKEMGLLNSYSGLILPLAVDAMGIFLMKQFFEQLPRELEEAAALDGASTFGTFRHVMLPLAAPGLIALTILSIQGTWNEFLHILIARIGNPDLTTLPVGLAGLTAAFGQAQPWNTITAGALITIIPIAIVFFVFQRYFVQGTAASAIKG